MALLEKVKELTDEIKKTAEESGIKNKAKSATMILSDIVETSAKEIETRFEANLTKIEEERQQIMLEKKVILTHIQEASVDGDMLFNVSSIDLMQLASDFFEKIVVCNYAESKSYLTFGKYISRKIFKVFPVLKDETNEEVAIVQYYRNSKEYFLLTNQKLCFRGNHPKKDMNYGCEIELKDVHNISFEEAVECTVLLINGVGIMAMDANSAKLVDKFIQLVKAGHTALSPQIISDEIKLLIELNDLLSVNSYLEDDELCEAFVTNNYGESVVCTSKRVFVVVQGIEPDSLTVEIFEYDEIENAFVVEAVASTTLISKLINNATEVNLMFRVNGETKEIGSFKKFDSEIILNTIAKYNQPENTTVKMSSCSDGTEQVINVIKSLYELKQYGAITESEYDAKKNELLARI